MGGNSSVRIFWRNIEGRERQARTWRPGRETTSRGPGGSTTTTKPNQTVSEEVLMQYQMLRCEMYTEILSPSFVGMTFNQASVLCFSKVPHSSFPILDEYECRIIVESSYIMLQLKAILQKYLFSLNYFFLPSKPSRILVNLKPIIKVFIT